ncbi:hypothetical protein V5O39_10520 [Pseudomonas parakoreensis]
MTRPKALVWIILAWIALEFASWLLSKWLDTYANQQNLSAGLEQTKVLLSYITNGFSVGFVMGAGLFSMWDWPVIGNWLKRYRQRIRNKDADEILASKCEDLAQKLYESASQFERFRTETFWRTTQEDTEDAWIKARESELREEERIRGQLGHKMQCIIIDLKHRGVRMNLWGLSLRSQSLVTASYFFAAIASSLKAGDYLEREFEVSRTGLPAMM